MSSTTAGTYTTPDSTAPVDVPADLTDLAQQVEDKALHHTGAAGRRRVHVQTGLTATTDASGYATFAHGAPFTPRACQLFIARNAVSLAYLISAELQADGLNVTARFGVWNATGTLNSQSLGSAAITIVSWE